MGKSYLLGIRPYWCPYRGLCQGLCYWRCDVSSPVPVGRRSVWSLKRARPGGGRKRLPKSWAPAREGPSALEIAQGNFLIITVTSRAPSLPVNHYMGRAVSSGFLACFAAGLVYYWSRGLGWCLDCTLIGGPLAAAQPSLDTGVRTLLGNWTIYVVSTLRPKPLRGPGAEHPTAPPGESAERKLGPRKPRPREESSESERQRPMSHSHHPQGLCSESKHWGRPGHPALRSSPSWCPLLPPLFVNTGADTSQGCIF